MSLGRNEPCHCGSGKKYKTCHWKEDRDQSAAALTSDGDKATSARTASAPSSSGALGAFSTLQVAGGALVVVLAISGVLWLVDLARAAQIFAGVMVFVIMIWSAFRDPPPVREDTDDSASINFGRRD